MSGGSVRKKKVVAKHATKAVARKLKPSTTKSASPPRKKSVPKAGKPAIKAVSKAMPRVSPSTARVSAQPSTAKPQTAALPNSIARNETVADNKPPVKRVEQRYAGLSESDLLRAPVSQYMNEAQLAFFREHLLEMQRELFEKAGMTSEHLREHDIEPDPTDQATIEEEYALELRARDRERKLLKKIEQSLRRIEEGSYGYCEETGEPIGIPRLLARPTATLSIEAQARREMKQKLYGD